MIACRMTYDQLVSHYGTHAKAARALGLTWGALYFWRKTGIPALRQLWIERETGGALKADTPKAA